MRTFFTIWSLFLTTICIGQELADSSKRLTFTAGEQIVLKYCLNNLPSDISFEMRVSHSYGITLLKGDIKEDELTFVFPLVISKRAGILRLTLLSNNQVNSTSAIEILPAKSSALTLESYCGPKHLITGESDFSMVVTSVLDSLDNPLKAGEEVDYSYLSDNNRKNTTGLTDRLMGYKRFYAPAKKGYGAVSASYGNISDKAFRLDFYAHDPVNFKIAYDRQHNYADGEQLVYFKTEIIKDKNGNVVGDGTVVNFLIKDAKGKLSELMAQTISGVAECMRYAPYSQDLWQVEAVVSNYASSQNKLQINFLPSVTDFVFVLNTRSQTLQVGPVMGYLGQWVKEGTPIQFKIEFENDSQQQVKGILEKGKYLLDMEKIHAKGKIVQIEISVSGITKTLKF